REGVGERRGARVGAFEAEDAGARRVAREGEPDGSVERPLGGAGAQRLRTRGGGEQEDPRESEQPGARSPHARPSERRDDAPHSRSPGSLNIAWPAGW